jgi:RNA polymerase sigma factor (sigma-70 family)
MILHFARPRLRLHGLSRQLDPEDIAQEVFARFFQRVIGQRNFASLQEVVKLLIGMATNLIRDQARRAGRQRRGSGRTANEQAHLEAIACSEHEASYDIEIEEAINQIHTLMSEEEWSLAWARASGKTWSQMANLFGQSANGLRMKLSRALARARDKLSPGRGRKPPTNQH